MHNQCAPHLDRVGRSRFTVLCVAGFLAVMVFAAVIRPTSAEQVITGQNTIPTANLWLVHAAPFASSPAASSVTVVISNTVSSLQINDMRYLETTGGYLAVPSGVATDVTVTPTGSTIPLAMDTYTLTNKTDSTVAVIGGANGFPTELLKVMDDNSAPPKGMGKLRIIHVAPIFNPITGTVLDVRTQDGATLNPLFNTLTYKADSGYVTLPFGYYDLKATTPGGGTTVIDIPSFPLGDQTIVTLFLVGDGTNQPLAGMLMAYQEGMANFIFMPLVLK